MGRRVGEVGLLVVGLIDVGLLVGVDVGDVGLLDVGFVDVGFVDVGLIVVGLLVVGLFDGFDVGDVGLLVVGFLVVGLLDVGILVGRCVGAAMGHVLGFIKVLSIAGPLVTFTQPIAPSSPCFNTWQWRITRPPKSAMRKRTLQVLRMPFLSMPFVIVSYHSPSSKWYRPIVPSQLQPPGVTTCIWYTWRWSE